MNGTGHIIEAELVGLLESDLLGGIGRVVFIPSHLINIIATHILELTWLRTTLRIRVSVGEWEKGRSQA